MAVQIRLYDSLSRAVQPVDTHNGHLTMYVCGITPYATTHLGHLFTYAMADILLRYLEDRGVRVTYVQNVTDIDEPLLQEAQKQHEPWQALGKRWTIHFINDMQTMNIRPPTHYPRATEVIPDILASITRLLDAEVAYAAGGSVYFHVPAWPAYGTLSGLSYQDMVPLARARGHHADDPHTRHPLDFPLWQARQPGEPAWPSPWGLGRPGWHIECSTMAQRFLGAPIDIHGGGTDLLFPHHESEMAQAEGATGQRPFVRHWFHTAMVRHQGEKMSKSLGNLVMVRELLDTYSPDGVRLYVAQHHYRQEWEHDAAMLRHAEQLAHTWRAAVLLPGGPPTAAALHAETAHTAVATALEDDLQTPRAVAVLSQLAHRIHAAARERQNVAKAQRVLQQYGQILGLRLAAEGMAEHVRHGWDMHLARLH
jgi:L-cysteine:1D-myo-inositol 2-amino-2-deoxy-alpha-D-glucopyranoside ligase